MWGGATNTSSSTSGKTPTVSSTISSSKSSARHARHSWLERKCGAPHYRRGRPAPRPQLPPLPPPSIFVVGDRDQCIYAFRGANYTNVARFVEDFKGCQTVFLGENYRSTATIARAATAVIEKVSDRAEQTTITRAVQVNVGIDVVEQQHDGVLLLVLVPGSVPVWWHVDVGGFVLIPIAGEG